MHKEEIHFRNLKSMRGKDDDEGMKERARDNISCASSSLEDKA